MWHGIHGHDDVVERFRQTLAAGRLASTYLFVGPPGVGKKRFALQLAQSLLCTESDEKLLEPCGRCDSCRLFLAGNHPDLQVKTLPADKSSLPIGMFIGSDTDPKYPWEESVCYHVGLKPFFGRHKLSIVDDADHFSISSANCLLKTLEEPPPSAVLILIGTSPSRQLPTIRSRAQIVRFRPLAVEIVAQALLEGGLVADENRALEVAALSQGSIERAMQLSDSAYQEFRIQLLKELRSRPLNGVRLGRSVQAFVDEVGKEASEKRERLRIVIGFAIEFYRDELRQSPVTRGVGARGDVRVKSNVAAVDACLTAIEYVDRNANLGLVIQHWSAELTRTGARKQLEIAAASAGRS